MPPRTDTARTSDMEKNCHAEYIDKVNGQLDAEERNAHTKRLSRKREGTQRISVKRVLCDWCGPEIWV